MDNATREERMAGLVTNIIISIEGIRKEHALDSEDDAREAMTAVVVDILSQEGTLAADERHPLIRRVMKRYEALARGED